MNKKMLMYSIFMINIVIWIVVGSLKFSEASRNVIDSNKTIISIKKGISLSNEQFVEILCRTTEKLSTDIALQYLNEDYTYTYYRTTIDEEFMPLYTEDGSSLPINGKVYSSNPKSSEIKIYGFISKEDAIIISNINDILSIEEINLSKGNYLIQKEKKDEFIKELELYDIECENTVGVVDETEYTLLYILMFMFVMFSAISIVFFAFSQNRDMAVKKSMGYGIIRICYEKVRKSFLVFILELFIIVLLSIIIFSYVYGSQSSFIFIKYIMYSLLLLIASEMMIFVGAFSYVSLKCNVQHIKGKSRDRELFMFTTLFKAIVFVVMISALSYTLKVGYDIYKIYNTTKKTEELTRGYAATEINVSIENPEEYEDAYIEYFTDFYLWLYENHNAIVAKINVDAKYRDENPYIYPMGSVNDHYIDFCDSIIGVNGERITSLWLEENKLNVLIPEGYNTTRYSQLICRQYKIESKDIHYIEYDRDSRFFTFDNELNNQEDGYCEEVILKVFDINYDKEHFVKQQFFDTILDYFTGSIFFNYELDNGKTAFQQIKEGIHGTGLEKVMVTSPSVHKVFKEKLNIYIEQFIINAIVLLIYIFAFIAMVIYTSELYYKNNAKDIAVKKIYGYSFFSIFGNRIILKMAILPIVFIFKTEILDFAPIVAFSAVIFEIIVFVILMKAHIYKNVVTVIKGE